jgi:hypothetical protein
LGWIGPWGIAFSVTLQIIGLVIIYPCFWRTGKTISV